MEKLFASILLLMCSVLLIHMNRRYRRMCLKKVHLKGLEAFFLDVIFDSTLYVYFTNYLFPTITHIIFNYSVIEEEGVTPLELTVVYMVETFSWWLFYHVFYRQCATNKKALSYRMVSGKVLNLIAIFLLGLYIVSRMSTLGQSEEEPSEWEQRLFFIIPFVNVAGYMLAIFIVFAGRQYFSKFVWGMALAAMGAYLLGACLGGIRGAIVTPIVWAAYVVYKLRPARLRKKYYIAFGTALLIFALIQPIFMGFRAMAHMNLTLEEKIEMANKIASTKSHQNTESKYEANNLLNEMDYRYGAQGTYTVGFYRLVEREGYVGLNCIKNSFFTFIPSVLYGGEKPVSTSSDGTMEGMGMYKCVNAINGSNNMCEFFTSGHAYWELGILGVILFSIIPALFDFWCIRLFRKLDILGLPLYTVFFMRAYNTFKMWVSFIVVGFAQVVLPVLLLIWFYSFTKNSKKRRAQTHNEQYLC